MFGNNKNLKHNTIILIIAATIFGITYIAVSHFDSITNFLYRILRLTYPFIIGLFMAYLLTPITNKIIKKLERSKLKNKSYKKLNTLAIIIVETLFILTIITVISSVLTGVVGSGYNIVMKLPSAFEQFKDMLDDLIKDHDILKNIVGHTSTEAVDNAIKATSEVVVDNFEEIMANVYESTRNFGKHIIDFVFGVIISIFALANRAQFKRQSIKLLKAVTPKVICDKVIDICVTANNKFSGFFIGKLIDSAIIGVICIICMWLMDMPYILLISIIIFITNIIPIIGPIIGAIPGIIIIFSESPVQAIYFAIFILILQQIDGHIIGPKCIGSAIGLNTFYTLFALIIAGGLWGITGMLIGVPLFSVIYSLIADLANYLLKKRNLEGD